MSQRTLFMAPTWPLNDKLDECYVYVYLHVCLTCDLIFSVCLSLMFRLAAVFKSLKSYRTYSCKPFFFPTCRTATENVYSLLQPSRSAARLGSPGDGADGRLNDQQKKNTLALSPPSSLPHPASGGGKHPFYSPREVTQPNRP